MNTETVFLKFKSKPNENGKLLFTLVSIADILEVGTPMDEFSDEELELADEHLYTASGKQIK